MKYALHSKDDRGEPITLKELIEEEGSADPKKWDSKPHCPDCLQPVFAWDKRGALTGFHVTRDEVTRPRAQPGFHHYPVEISDKKSPVLTCPSSFRDDERFNSPNMRDLIDSNQFRHAERKRNEFALDDPKRKKALEAFRRYLMKRLTGKDGISEQDEQELNKARKGLITLAGLAEHPWALPYLEVLTITSRKRETKSRFKNPKAHDRQIRISDVKFDQSGTQKLPLTFANGEKGFLHLPTTITPSFRKKTGKLVHMINPQTKQELALLVSREFATYHAREILENDLRVSRSQSIPIQKTPEPIVSANVPVSPPKSRSKRAFVAAMTGMLAF